MKKKLVTALCTATAAAIALPAFAVTNEITGFLEARGVSNNYGGGSLTDFATANSQDYNWAVQRLRAKWTLGVNEFVSMTYFGELDFEFGDASLANGRGDGGAIQGDTVNLETKNLYMSAKVPNTPVSATIGLQGLADNWSTTLVNTDVAGVNVGVALDPATVKAGWFKLWEGSQAANDDVDLWAIQVGLKPINGLKLGFDFYYVNDNNSSLIGANGKASSASEITDTAATTKFNFGTSTGAPGTKYVFVDANGNGALGQNDTILKLWESADIYWLGFNAAYDLKLGENALNVKAWAMYNWGTLDNYYRGEDDTDEVVRKDADVNAYAGDVTATMAVAGGAKVGLEGFYISGDKNLTGGDVKQPMSLAAWSGTPITVVHKNNVDTVTTGGGGGPETPFAKTGLMILLFDPMGDNFSNFAARDALGVGLGLNGLVLSGSFTPPDLKQLTLSGALGYINSSEDAKKAHGAYYEDDNNYALVGRNGGANLGTELALRAAYKVADNFEVSLNGAYVWLGDFYNNWTPYDTRVIEVADDEGGTTTARVQKFKDPENPYLAYLMAKVSF